ncbi:metal ABC transporter substrate-binding protein [Persicimonas caeni]|nr:metal ABC transporter substrate-binding protein [Persicimonas caeni]
MSLIAYVAGASLPAGPLITVATLLLALLLPQTAMAKVDIVTTVGDLAAVAKEVGGEHVSVELLASPQQDPHFVDAKPSFVRDVAKADLLIVNGMSLEAGWLPALVESSRNAKVQIGADGYFDASEHIARKGVPQGEISRAQGDVHPEGNPHYTLEPRQMARVALALGKRLAKLDPDHAKAYKTQAKAFAKKGLQTAKYWKKQFESLPKQCRNVVVYHEAWVYLTDWLSLNVVLPIEPKPGVPPNPKHVAKVFKTMKSEEVPVVIQMEYYPNSNTEMITKKTGAYLLIVQGQTREDQDYFSRVNKMAGELYSAVKARCE